ncbi:MAG: chemotaxis protein CheA [Burkholderiales bacterium]|nr:chemotaxis protein CheA [Burkholderiales bacterium]
MNDFAGNEEILQDFLQEAGDLLSDVDNKLVDLEKNPDDKKLLNDIFRNFHTIKGGAGFLNATEMVKLCHLTENLFDKLRNAELTMNPAIMDAIFAATGEIRNMFGSLAHSTQPSPADPDLLARLASALKGETIAPSHAPAKAPAAGPDWDKLYHSLTPAPTVAEAEVPARRESDADAPRTLKRESDSTKNTRRESDKAAVEKETTIRIDTARLDQVLNLSGEIGLTKNRLNCLRNHVLQGKTDQETLRDLDEAVNQLDLLVGVLQNAVMKTRMQPVGRLFQKYPRMARDLARQLGKEMELVISGEETELDKTMIEELSDPLVHLIRNAVDHGIETPEERRAMGKPEKSIVTLSAIQAGDHIVIEITDDGRGMNANALKRKALEKGIIDEEALGNLDEQQSLGLIFMPGFSTKDQISSVSGRGVGMDVVKTNIQKLNGRIEIASTPGKGSTFSIYLPLTLAILPVLIVQVCKQSFAVPLAMVREIIPIHPEEVQSVSGRATMVVRNEVLPIRALVEMIGWSQDEAPAYGVLMKSGVKSFILAVNNFVGREDVVIKPLKGIKPKGVAGATLSGDGSIVLILDMEELLSGESGTKQSLFVQTTSKNEARLEAAA